MSKRTGSAEDDGCPQLAGGNAPMGRSGTRCETLDKARQVLQPIVAARFDQSVAKRMARGDLAREIKEIVQQYQSRIDTPLNILEARDIVTMLLNGVLGLQPAIARASPAPRRKPRSRPATSHRRRRVLGPSRPFAPSMPPHPRGAAARPPSPPTRRRTTPSRTRARRRPRPRTRSSRRSKRRRSASSPFFSNGST